MLDVIVGMGGGVSVPASSLFRILCGTGRFKFNGYSSYMELLTESGEDFTPALSRLPLEVTVSDYGIGFRNSSQPISGSGVFIKQHFLFYGDYNYDNVRLSITNFEGRVEVRNENGVLITDNGFAWPDGTYPPDAKNRAGLTGLHAAPAVINPELDTALMGDETNKERVQE